MKKTIIGIGLTLLILAAFWLWMRPTSLFDRFRSLFRPAEVVIDETAILIEEIKPLAKLMTLTFSDEVVADSAKGGGGFSSLLPLNGGALLQPSIDRLVIIGKGKVIIGTDLMNLSGEDIKINGDTLRVQIPPAEILETVMNPADYEVFHEKGNWPESAVIALKLKMKRQMEQHALSQNLPALAQQRSIHLLEEFLETTKYKVVEVTVK